MWEGSVLDDIDPGIDKKALLRLFQHRQHRVSLRLDHSVWHTRVVLLDANGEDGCPLTVESIHGAEVSPSDNVAVDHEEWPAGVGDVPKRASCAEWLAFREIADFHAIPVPVPEVLLDLIGVVPRTHDEPADSPTRQALDRVLHERPVADRQQRFRC